MPRIPTSPYLYTPNRKVLIEVSSFRFTQWSHQQTSAARISILPGVDPKEPKAGLVCAKQFLEKHCTTIKRNGVGVNRALSELMSKQILHV